MSNPAPTNATLGNPSQPHQALIQQLDLMIRARYPLLYLVAAEEDPTDEILHQIATQGKPVRKLLFWDIVRGWNDNGSDKGSVMGALGRINKGDPNEPALFVLRDLHPILKHPESDKNAPIIREIKNLTKDLKRSRKTLIFTSYTLAVPPELQEEMTVVDIPLPNLNEINYLITQLVQPEKLNVNGLGKEQLIKACQGLSRARISRVLASAIAAKQQVNESDIDRVPKKPVNMAFPTPKACCWLAFKAQANPFPLKPSPMNGVYPYSASMRGVYLEALSEKVKVEFAR